MTTNKPHCPRCGNFVGIYLETHGGWRCVCSPTVTIPDDGRPVVTNNRIKNKPGKHEN